MVSSVNEWQGGIPYKCSGQEMLFHDRQKHLFVLTLRRTFSKGCIVCAIASIGYERLQEKIGLSSVVSALQEVKGVLSIEMEDEAISHINIRPIPSRSMVLVEIPVEGKTLLVRLDATLYKDSIRRLRRNFLVISLLILTIGAILSYWLYRKQKGEMLRAIEIEKAMSQQREEAMIGRAAATIAHEVRNPLNAIYMGLQRVLMEADYLNKSEARLLELSLQSVKQVNGIVSDSKEAMNILIKYPYPGNVRELEHIVQRTITLTRSSLIMAADLPPEVRTGERLIASGKGALKERLKAVEREMILSALERADWVQTRAAEELGISERVLRYKIEKHGLKRLKR